jgi:hypothetical protein
MVNVFMARTHFSGSAAVVGRYAGNCGSRSGSHGAQEAARGESGNQEEAGETDGDDGEAALAGEGTREWSGVPEIERDGKVDGGGLR